MNVRRNLGRMGMTLLVASSMGALPAGSCAKACGSGSRAASRGGGRSAARLASHSDDLARLGARGRGLPGRMPVGVPLGGVGGVGDDLAHLSATNLDGAVAALPEIEGATSRLASVPSSRGARVVERGGARRSFGRDYGKSIDELKIRRDQHEALVDALDATQSLAEEAVGQLVDYAMSNDSSYEADDQDDEGAVGRPPPSAAAAATARRRLDLAAAMLDRRLARILDPDQLEQLHATLGSSEVIAYRLGRERPIER